MRFFLVLTIFATLLTATAHAQYQGTKPQKDTDSGPTLRATGVFEWTGDLNKPKAGRLVPIAVWDGSDYQPGGLYLAQPAPLTVLTGTVYELEKAGIAHGLFNVNGAENLGGSWIAIGSVKPQMAAAKAKPTTSKRPPQVVRDVGSSTAAADSGRPTLHRKDESSTTTSSGSSSGSSSTTGGSSTSSSNTPPSDPDKPTLHRRSGSDSSGSGDSGSSSGNSSGSTQSAPDVDPDRPTLHRKDSDSAQNAPSPDPDRPTLHKRSDSTGNPTGAPVTSTASVDPDRPKLRYGKPESPEGIVQPSKLEGVPADMNQMIAISDIKTGEPHSYVYSWTDPADAAKMKSATEELAQKALAGTASEQAQPTPKPAAKTTTAHRRATKPAAPPLPLLADEKFNAFELSYSGGATIVFSAKTGDLGNAKYITLIAQPDFYGTPQVIFKQITTDDRLDIIPRLRLVDAADTDNDHRAELIFQLQGKTTREFAIYRIINRQVQQAFNTGPLP